MPAAVFGVPVRAMMRAISVGAAFALLACDSDPSSGDGDSASTGAATGGAGGSSGATGGAGEGGGGNGTGGAGGRPTCETGSVWSKLFGDYLGAATGVAVDEAGNIVVVGSYQGASDFGGGLLTSAGAKDAFVAKFDAAGNHLWSKSFGSAGDQVAVGVGVDGAADILVAGTFWDTVDFGGGPLTSAGDGDVFVAKLSASGDHAQSASFGGAGLQRPTSVAANASGSLVVAGNFDGVIDFGLGPLAGSGGSPGSDGFVVVFDAAGNAVWNKRYGNTDDNMVPLLTDVANDVAIDASGAVYLVGSYHGIIDLGSGPITSQGVAQDALVAKLEADGTPAWLQSWSAQGMFASGVNASVIAVDTNGDAVVGGSFIGTLDAGAGPMTSTGQPDDFFVVKLGALGQATWSAHYATGGAADSLTDLATDASGNIVLAARFEGELDFGGGPVIGHPQLYDNAVLVKLDAGGAHQWSATYATPGQQPLGAMQALSGIAIDGCGYIAVGGFASGAIDLGQGSLVAKSSDAVLARLAP